MKPEALKNKSSKKSTKPLIEYRSNPFSLAFNKFGLFFENNLGWAIAIISISLLYGMFQFAAQIPSLLEPDTSETTTSFEKQNSTKTQTTESSDLKKFEEDNFKMPQIDEKDFPAIGIIVLIIVLVLLLVTGLVLLQVLVTTFVFGILTYVALENDAGRKASLSSAIDAVVARFRRLFLATLLANLKIFGWTLLLIVPGIIATFRYALLPFVIMDESPKKRGIVASHDRVKQIVTGRKREVFGVATVAVIIPIIGTINQYVGNAALYRQLQVYVDQEAEKPPVHWLNYFGFFLIGIYLLFILSIVALFAIFALSSS